MARPACLVCLFSTVNGCSKNKEKSLGSGGASSGHTTNLKQSIFYFDIYGMYMPCIYTPNKHSLTNGLFTRPFSGSDFAFS